MSKIVDNNEDEKIEGAPRRSQRIAIDKLKQDWEEKGLKKITKTSDMEQIFDYWLCNRRLGATFMLTLIKGNHEKELRVNSHPTGSWGSGPYDWSITEHNGNGEETERLEWPLSDFVNVEALQEAEKKIKKHLDDEWIVYIVHGG
jgi:hypothetical protein